MKIKFLCLALFVCIGLACLTGCGCSKENKSSADVHVFYYTYSDPYISSVRSALSNKLQEAGLSVQEYDSNNSQTTQTEQVQTAITKGAKMIVVNIVTTGSDDASSGIVRMARDAGIPVVFFNREVSDSVVNSYDKCAFVGTNAAEAGYLQGDMVGDYVTENFDQVDLNGDGRISYVLFMGEQGNNEAIYRTKYSVENANKKLTAASQNELVFYDSGNTDGYLLDKEGKWSAQAANEYMTTALTSYNAANDNMIELIICNNDNMAEGAITALQTAGFNTGVEGATTIPVFGVDATDAAKELIKAGKMAGTIKQDADGMAATLAKTAKNGIEEKGLLDGMGDYTIDENTAKVRIPYGIYLGEE